jgi:hypothetical protein
MCWMLEWDMLFDGNSERRTIKAHNGITLQLVMSALIHVGVTSFELSQWNGEKWVPQPLPESDLSKFPLPTRTA